MGSGTPTLDKMSHAAQWRGKVSIAGGPVNCRAKNRKYNFKYI